MIIVNGQIICLNPEGKKTTQSFGFNLPYKYDCNIKTISADKRGNKDYSTYGRASYEILVDQKDCFFFEAKRVQLVDSRGQNLGEFVVQDVRYLNSVGVIKIFV